LLVQIAVLGYGAYLVLEDHSLSAGVIFAGSIISARALAPLDQAIGGWRSFVAALQSHHRVKQLLAATAEKSDRMALPEPRASLSAERLIYATAPGTEAILKGISFKIEPGETVGVIGPSGAGKSTLARLLVGALKPSSGLIRIGGDDIQHWSSEALGPYVGYVPQDVELFPATVAQNIARMTASPDPAKVVSAAQLANCHELIQRLPKGYDTLLGPQGHALSGGQRQRLALARAFYGQPNVVVLDEPNANLDVEGEQALTSALIEAQKAGITCVVITQRTAVVRALTKIMVLKDGRIDAFGPREEVLQQQIRPAASPTQSPAPVRRLSAATSLSAGAYLG
jgi:ATP-binding cassette subfamily C protein